MQFSYHFWLTFIIAVDCRNTDFILKVRSFMVSKWISIIIHFELIERIMRVNVFIIDPTKGMANRFQLEFATAYFFTRSILSNLIW